ncbi:hypothetical protein D3C73_784830 [compost metagenome]
MAIVIYVLVFQGFENQPIKRKIMFSRRFQGAANAQFRTVHGIWHEVDRQVCLHVEAGCTFDGPRPTELIEAVSIGVCDLLEHGQRAFTGNTAHQGFMGKNRLIPEVDDRLIGKAEVEIQGLALLAASATALGRCQ